MSKVTAQVNNESYKKIFLTSLLVLLPILLMFISLFIGRYPLAVSDVIGVFAYKAGLIDGVNLTRAQINVVWDVRLPRILLAVMVGASLAISGAAFQGLFRNPLVSSGILGVSNGAGFGAALAIIFFDGNYLYVYLFAFFFAMLAVFLSYLIGHTYKTTPTIMLVLGGVIVSAVFSSLISLLKYMADPYDQLPSIVFWLMGSLASVHYQDLMIGAIPMTIGILGLLAMRWHLNVMSMEDSEAQALGINIYLYKGLTIILLPSRQQEQFVWLELLVGWVSLSLILLAC